MADRPRGTISCCYSAHCGCGEHFTGALEEQDSASGCAKAAQAAGWTHTRKDGWRCPTCSSGVSHVCGRCANFGGLPGDYQCEGGARARTWFASFVDRETGTLSCAAEDCPGFAAKGGTRG